jgi:hypothetical protein
MVGTAVKLVGKENVTLRGVRVTVFAEEKQ